MKTSDKKPRRNWRPFEEAREFARSLNLQNQTAWREWSKSNDRPLDIPNYPDDIYKNNGWTSWGDWLGTGRIANQNKVYLPFKEARLFAHTLGLQTSSTWKAWAKSDDRSDNIPASPDRVYKNNGWISWGDWLGTNHIAHKNMVSLLKKPNYLRVILD